MIEKYIDHAALGQRRGLKVDIDTTNIVSLFKTIQALSHVGEGVGKPIERLQNTHLSQHRIQEVRDLCAGAWWAAPAGADISDERIRRLLMIAYQEGYKVDAGTLPMLINPAAPHLDHPLENKGIKYPIENVISNTLNENMIGHIDVTFLKGPAGRANLPFPIELSIDSIMDIVKQSSSDGEFTVDKVNRYLATINPTRVVQMTQIMQRGCIPLCLESISAADNDFGKAVFYYDSKIYTPQWRIAGGQEARRDEGPGGYNLRNFVGTRYDGRRVDWMNGIAMVAFKTFFNVVSSTI